MAEELWFILLIWLVLLIANLKFKKHYFIEGLLAFISIMNGILVATQVYAWLGFTFIIAGIYFLYDLLFKVGSRK